MAKTEMIRARITPDLKTEAESIFKKLGLSTTEAITLFLSQVKLYKYNTETKGGFKWQKQK